MKITNVFIAVLVAVSFSSFAQKKSKKDHLVTLETKFGIMHLVLFDDTPLHKANFIKLAESGFYNDLLFHRIIQDFMIQGGDPNSRNATADARLGMGGGDMEKIPFEFTSKHIHKKGALAAAHDGNKEKKSSACQFYIVDGTTYTDDQLTAMQQRNKMEYTTKDRSDYMILGGYPSLDNNYTVFGEVIDNLALIDTLSSQPKNSVNRPNEDIKMTVSVKKMRKKKISKFYGYKY